MQRATKKEGWIVDINGPNYVDYAFVAKAKRKARYLARYKRLEAKTPKFRKKIQHAKVRVY